MKEFTIGINDAGQRLDRFLAKAVPTLPASLAQKYIRIKRVKVGDRGADRGYKLVVGDTVQMYINDEFFENPRIKNTFLENTDPALDIIYEDSNIMLIDKKEGILSHSNGLYDYSSAIVRIQAYLSQKGQWRPGDENSFAPALCNRIDRNTSGIVIAAKNAESLRIINEKLKTREIGKYYLAITLGAPHQECGILESYIFKDSTKNRVYVSTNGCPGAKPAAMKYRTIATEGRLSLLECCLITGRTHQIRAQLASIGCPLLGDGKYGNDRQNKPYGESHQALCSYKLVFEFITDAGMLTYLGGNTYQIHNIPFVKKYFPDIDFI
ncbi:MAG: RluA family pseudouridine synthase [Oscillospiraceae bacterium]|nr:RluA family pseudouridine synthase [Oscillospiraceae bacterium]